MVDTQKIVKTKASDITVILHIQVVEKKTRSTPFKLTKYVLKCRLNGFITSKMILFNSDFPSLQKKLNFCKKRLQGHDDSTLDVTFERQHVESLLPISIEEENVFLLAFLVSVTMKSFQWALLNS